MKAMAMRFVKLMAGLFLISLGVVLTCQAGLGIAPWDVLHQGLAAVTSMTMGQMSIGVGVCVLIVDLLARERIGLGTLINLVFIGVFMDVISACNARLGLIPTAQSLPMGLLLLALSFPPMAYGMYLYMSPKMGAGPRDSLMVAVTRRLPCSVGVCRMIIEAIVLLVGWLLGGTVGIGTVILVLLNGPAMQLCFQLCHFDVEAKPNESVAETLNAIWMLRKTKAAAGAKGK